MSSAERMGRPGERRKCAKAGCWVWTYGQQFCIEHFRQGLKRIDRSNIVERKPGKEEKRNGLRN
jgi:hypothetical protein